MGKSLLWAIVAGGALAFSTGVGCKGDEDSTDDDVMDSGPGDTGKAPDKLNLNCPNMIPPLTGDYGPRGECCYRTANSTRVEEQGDGPDVTLEYRLNYVQTINHDKTIGSDAVRALTTQRIETEQQSVLWRFKGPREDAASASGPGTIEIGSGRYNCDGTYSFYSDTAAPKTATQDDPARWEPPIVPVNIDATITDPTMAQLRVVPDFAKNANRGYTYTPYVRTSADPKATSYEIDWELVNQGFTIESLPTDDSALNCVGSRNDDGMNWTAGGTFIVYTPLAVNDTDPISDLMGQTYCQLVAFGFVGNKKDSPNYSCKTTARCEPGSKDCTWAKLPDSLCPVNADEQALWGCHIGDENNPDGEKTHCTADAPTDALDPAKGATSEGQCCDPLGKSKSLPACNAYFLRNEYVAAAADITDDKVDTLQADCHEK